MRIPISTDDCKRWHTHVLFVQGSTNKRIMVQAGLGVKRDPISKITKDKRAGGVAQVVKCLPNKCEALSSIPTSKTHLKKRLPNCIRIYRTI
jgi:hypothetical protein